MNRTNNQQSLLRHQKLPHKKHSTTKANKQQRGSQNSNKTKHKTNKTFSKASLGIMTLTTCPTPLGKSMVVTLQMPVLLASGLSTSFLLAVFTASLYSS